MATRMAFTRGLGRSTETLTGRLVSQTLSLYPYHENASPPPPPPQKRILVERAFPRAPRDPLPRPRRLTRPLVGSFAASTRQRPLANPSQVLPRTNLAHGPRSTSNCLVVYFPSLMDSQMIQSCRNAEQHHTRKDGAQGDERHRIVTRGTQEPTGAAGEAAFSIETGHQLLLFLV